MSFSTLRIKMLGEFSLEYNGKKISDDNNRSKKVWLLLAYIIYYRNKAISKSEIIDMLWVNQRKCSDTNNSLKAILHRLRKLLEELDINLSQNLIFLNKGYFHWNSDIPLKLDIEDFENYCNKGLNAQNFENRLSFFSKAIDIYKGKFLPRFNSDYRVLSITTFYHNLYVKAAQQTVLLLEQKTDYKQVCILCKKCCQLDPYNEFFYQHLMKNMTFTGSSSDISSVYYEMERLFESSLGAKPSTESINIFHSATHQKDKNRHSASDIFSVIEIKDVNGCFFCNYDTFQAMHRLVACSIARSHTIAHIAVLSIQDLYGKSLSNRSLSICNSQIDLLLKNHLRKTDIVCKYNQSQYLILLLHSTEYNCIKALERIVYLYKRSYPRSPAVLSYALNEVKAIL